MTGIHPYGYRIEGKSLARAIVAGEPYYFRHPTDFDGFAGRRDIEVPDGHRAAGLWFFNDIAGAGKSVAMLSDNKSCVTRINVRALQNVDLIEDKLFNAGLVSVALTFYRPPAGEPTATQELTVTQEQFAKSVTVPDRLVEIWSGASWIRKDEIGLFDFDRIFSLQERGKYSAPTAEQAVRPIGNEPHVAEPVPENWWHPEELRLEAPPANAREKLRRLFRAAQNKAGLRGIAQQRLKIMDGQHWHLHQAQIFKQQANADAEQIHRVHAAMAQPQLRRLQHEEIIIVTGKGFWELHDVQKWAAKVVQVERFGDSNALYAEVPSKAGPALHNAVKQLRSAALNERYGR